jgi:hypothetical protein
MDGDDARVCLWPGELQLAARDDGATFSLPVTVHARSAVPLPGDESHWPQDVASDGRALAVVPNEEGVPVVWLAPGQYRIEGRFPWDERPGIDRAARRHCTRRIESRRRCPAVRAA